MTPISRRKLIKTAVFGGLALTGIDAFAVEPRWLETTYHAIPIKGLGPEFDGYRIALLSDFHLPVSSRHLVLRALTKAVRFHPDLIAMPGDFVDGRRKGQRQMPLPSFKGMFDLARAPDGVVGTLGNHDHWLDADGVRAEIAAHTPIKLIENEHVLLKRGNSTLAIGGVGDLWRGIVMPATAFGGVSSDVPRILLSHNPDLAEDMDEDVRVDLQLSGHTHGGQVRLPMGPAPWVPSKYGNKFREGLVEGKHHRVYTTRGVVSTKHARFWCRPEVTCITLRSA